MRSEQSQSVLSKPSTSRSCSTDLSTPKSGERNLSTPRPEGCLPSSTNPQPSPVSRFPQLCTAPCSTPYVQNSMFPMQYSTPQPPYRQQTPNPVVYRTPLSVRTRTSSSPFPSENSLTPCLQGCGPEPDSSSGNQPSTVQNQPVDITEFMLRHVFNVENAAPRLEKCKRGRPRKRNKVENGAPRLEKNKRGRPKRQDQTSSKPGEPPHIISQSVIQANTKR